MGWNYDREEDKEKKTYPVVGSVTLSTEEYTDMVNELYATKRKADKEHDDWYAEYKAKDGLEKENKTLKEQLATERAKRNEVFEWLDSNKEYSDAFKTWKAEKLLKQSEESEEE